MAADDGRHATAHPPNTARRGPDMSGCHTAAIFQSLGVPAAAGTRHWASLCVAGIPLRGLALRSRAKGGSCSDLPA